MGLLFVLRIRQSTQVTSQQHIRVLWRSREWRTDAIHSAILLLYTIHGVPYIIIIIYNLCVCTGSADAILLLSNAGASVTAADKDGLTGKSTTYIVLYFVSSYFIKVIFLVRKFEVWLIVKQKSNCCYYYCIPTTTLWSLWRRLCSPSGLFGHPYPIV